MTLLVTGLMYPKWVLVRNDLASATVVPMKIGMDGSGLGSSAGSERARY